MTSPFGVEHFSKAYDYSGGEHVGYQYWDHPTQGMIDHATKVALHEGRRRLLHPTTWPKARRVARAIKAERETLKSYKREGRYAKPVYRHLADGEEWHSIGEGQQAHPYRGNYTPLVKRRTR